MATIEVGVHEAKSQLSALLRRVLEGDDVVIRRGATPVARLVAVDDIGPRPLGVDAGLFEVPDDFDDPLPDDVLDEFGR
jgi:prevent-host-death family protein